MKLITIDDVRGGSPGARLASGAVLHLGRAARQGTIEAWLPSTIVALLEGGDEAMAIARRIVERAEAGSDDGELQASRALLPADMPLLSPIPAPRMVLAAGLAYRSHLAEMSNTPEPAHPTAFMKSPASILAPGASLELPSFASEQVDFEGELVCVFGKTCHAVTPEQALDHLAGFTVANDISARDWAQPCFTATDPWQARLTWEVNIMGKQLPGFTPVGPALVTRDEIPDINSLQLRTRLNGAVMQDERIGDMIFPIEEVISYFSRWYTFQPGDYFLTGTPAGVGVGRKPPVFLKPGDRIEVEIESLGTLSTAIVPPPR